MSRIIGLNSFLNLAIVLSLSLVLLPYYQVSGSSRDFSRKLGASQGGLCTVAASLRQYKCQDLEVTTKDGYILSISRIGSNSGGGGQGPVLLQHGLTADGMCWLAGSPEKNLPTILADNGYDVFISNVRGTQFSRRHTSMNSYSAKYWDWSWEELAEKDLPSIVGFMYKQTGQKAHYIGHSLGTLMALAALSEGLLVNYLKSAVLLSPIAYLRHTNVPPSIMSSTSSAGQMGPTGITANQVPTFGGKNCCLKLPTMTRFIQHKLQPSSYKNSVHLFQIGVSGKVAKYDYMLGNMARYGRLRPPVYDLTKIPSDFPLFLSYGGQDTLSDVIDVQTLLRDLGGHDRDKLKTQLIQKYAHIDFIMGDNANGIVYNQVLDFFTQFA